ncbi:hypothetical protein [Microbacterium testaceum]|uniref:hypothetical protein n=1 Tax=Microbacterium testaceum TaxID=2033 RepID=UPI001A9C478E|nr:hypothetical protein [Microbacterium testaceum]
MTPSWCVASGWGTHPIYHQGVSRILPSLLAGAIIVIALSGCAQQASSTSGMASESARPSASSPAPTATPTSPSPTPSASASPTVAPSRSSEPADDPFPTSALADVCVTGVLESGAPTARTDIGAAERAQEANGLWAVAVPGVTDAGADVLFLCTVSGTADAFQLELRAQIDGRLDASWQSRLDDLEAGRI